MSRHLDIQGLVVQGIRALQTMHDEQEKTKVGTLRGGSSGIAAVDDTGPILAGVCARKAHLRFIGVDTSQFEEEGGQEGSKEHMFAAGRGNEDIWADQLTRAWPGKVMREEEIPVQWELREGLKVTGRPDIVLCETQTRPYIAGVAESHSYKPVHGLELKLASSFWTVRDLLVKRQPKLEHVIQAALYMHLLSEQHGHTVPFSICYASRVNWWVPEINFVKMPGPGLPGSEHIEYKTRKLKDGTEKEPQAFKVLPFVLVFDIRFLGPGEDSPVQFRVAGEKAWQDTPVTRGRMRDYYLQVADMKEAKHLPPPPQNLTAKGEPQKDWNACTYCPLAAHCRSTEAKGYDEWLKPIQDGTLKLGK